VHPDWSGCAGAARSAKGGRSGKPLHSREVTKRPKSRKKGIQNSHVAAQAAVLGGVGALRTAH